MNLSNSSAVAAAAPGYFDDHPDEVQELDYRVEDEDGFPVSGEEMQEGQTYTLYWGALQEEVSRAGSDFVCEGQPYASLDQLALAVLSAWTPEDEPCGPLRPPPDGDLPF